MFQVWNVDGIILKTLLIFSLLLITIRHLKFKVLFKWCTCMCVYHVEERAHLHRFRSVPYGPCPDVTRGESWRCTPSTIWRRILILENKFHSLENMCPCNSPGPWFTMRYTSWSGLLEAMCSKYMYMYGYSLARIIVTCSTIVVTTIFSCNQNYSWSSEYGHSA